MYAQKRWMDAANAVGPRNSTFFALTLRGIVLPRTIGEAMGPHHDHEYEASSAKYGLFHADGPLRVLGPRDPTSWQLKTALEYLPRGLAEEGETLGCMNAECSLVEYSLILRALLASRPMFTESADVAVASRAVRTLRWVRPNPDQTASVPPARVSGDSWSFNSCIQ
jgi:hypothetical protein